MPYVQRNAIGKIVALTAEPGQSPEFLDAAHPEVLQVLATGSPNEAGQALLVEDLKLIRAIEDVIDLLIAKNVIIFSDLPSAVQTRILKKRGYRERLFGSGGDILGSDEGIL